MATRTPNDLIKLALKDSGILGIGQTPKAEDTNDAFDRLNMMLAQWQRKRWLVYTLVTTGITSTGAVSYTVGLGQNFSIARPDKLESAFQRQPQSGGQLAVDFPLEILRAREDYNQITLKGLTSFSNSIFYDSAYPVGRVYPWPILPASTYELHITTKVAIGKFTSLAQDINLPEEYEAAILYNLCARLRPAYRMAPDPTIVALAKDALNVIRTANAQIPRLLMPDSLVGGGGYNIYSDNN